MTEKRIPTTDVYSLYEAHEKIHPREVTGRFQRIRFWVISTVWIVFYGLAWIKWDDRQAILFDLPARQFHIFNITFWPQDFYLLTWLLILGALTLFLVTAIAGRIWCGYTCPQTVWTEAFLYFERLTEGNYRQRKKLDQSPWNWDKVWRKTAKQMLWIGFALWTGFTFVGYFTPIRGLGSGVLDFTLGGWQWFWFLFYSFATYGNAGFLREQVCQYMCPYARFQGAMLDKDSLTVSYNAARGEPRRAKKKAKTTEPALEENQGDCINCNICVQVCPTGIDIRDGSQYECIGCTACIDACDQVMDRVGKPRGLVGYASERELTEPEIPGLEVTGRKVTNNWLAKYQRFLSRVLRPRIVLYLVLWCILGLSFVLFVAFRSPVAIDIVRDRNAFFQISKPGYVDNVYTLKLMNKQQEPINLDISVEEYAQAELLFNQEQLKDVVAGAVTDLPLRIRLPNTNATGRPEVIHLRVKDQTSGREITEKTLFWRPKK